MCDEDGGVEMTQDVERKLKDTPLIFTGEMIRTLLDDRKTQTRRLNGLKAVNECPDKWLLDTPGVLSCTDTVLFEHRTCKRTELIKCRYGGPGDRIWGRENIWLPPPITLKMLREGADTDTWPAVAYTASLDIPTIEEYRKWGWKHVPSIFMPKFASRITREIVSVRLERLQEISEEDAIAEGVERTGGGRYWLGYDLHHVKGTRKVYGQARDAFRTLWDSINAARGYGWDTNPWVWVLELKKINAT
jgi:hypothetical protein